MPMRLTALALFSLLPAAIGAQPSTSNSWTLSQATLSGAGTTSTSSSFVLDGTLSQAATVGEASSTTFVLESGFWTSASITRSVTVLGGGSGQGTMTGSLVSCASDGGATSGVCDESAVHGTSLDIVAAPDASSTFDGWSGCTSTSTTTLADDTCTVVLTAERTVTASFTALDLLPPTIVLVDSDASTIDGVLSDCETVNGVSVYRLRVQFDDSMLDPAGDSSAGDVTNAASWLLVGPGPDGSFSTSDCNGPVGDDVQVAVSSISYEAGSNTATLQFASRFEGLYRLFACGTGASVLQDQAGNSLDGDADGTGGDDFLRFFRADPLNALADGHFDCSLGAWVPVSTNPLEITHSSDDVDLSTDSGSAAVTNLTMSSDFSLGQCIEAAGSTGYLLSAQLRLESENPGVFFRLSCEFFDGATCTGASLDDPLGFASLVADTGDLWTPVSTTLTTPAGTASALCAAELFIAGSDFDARVDQIELLNASLIFSDGFEAGNTQAWSAAVP